MKTVGTIKEIKNQETRVGLTPKAVEALVKNGVNVLVQAGSGEASGFSDTDYYMAGATLESDPRVVAQKSDILVKVKEPLPSEYEVLECLKGKTLYTFLHLSANPELARVLNQHEITGISYDTIEDEAGTLYMLEPMSRIAGEAAIKFSYRFSGQKVCRPINKIVVVGGGVVGTAAVNKALMENSSCQVTLVEKNHFRAQELSAVYSKSPNVVVTTESVENVDLSEVDLLVGAVLVKGDRAPKVVGAQKISQLPPGALIFDVAIDQGGCFEGSRPTSLDNPYFEENGLIYCCIPNLPASYGQEATEALGNTTFPHLLRMALEGPIPASRAHPGLFKGVNTHEGQVTNQTVQNAFKLI